jgi:hypothetical protein
VGATLVGLGSTTTSSGPSNATSALWGYGNPAAKLIAGFDWYKYPLPFPCTITRLDVSQGTTAGTFTQVVRKNSVNQTVTVTNAAPTDTTHTDSFAAGDTLGLCWTASSSGSVQRFQAILTATSALHAAVYGAGHSGAGAAANFGTTTYQRVGGGLAITSTTELSVRSCAATAGTLSNLYFYIPTNTCDGAATVVSRSNGANANQTFTIGAGLTGGFTDSTHSDAIAAGDTFAAQTVVAGTTGTVSLLFVASMFVPLLGQQSDIFAGAGTTFTGGTTYYLTPYGVVGTTWTTATPAQIALGFAATIPAFTVGIYANTATALSTWNIVVNGSVPGSGPAAAGIAAGATGFWTSGAGSVALAATDELAHQIAVGGTGNLGIGMAGVAVQIAPPGPPSLVGLGHTTTIAGTTGNFGPLVGFGLMSAGNPSEAFYAYPLPFAAQVSGLTAAQGPIGTGWSITARKNGANATQVISNSAPTDTTHSDSYIVGDTIDYIWSLGAASAVQRLQALIRPTAIPYAAIYACSHGSNGAPVAAGTTAYTRFCGTSVNQTAESSMQLQSGVAGAISNLTHIVVANATTAASTFISRVNGANGAQTISVGAGLTGVFRDATHSDALAVGDFFNGQVTIGAGGSVTLTLEAVMFVPSGGFQSDLLAVIGNPYTTGGTFFTPYGNASTGYATSDAATGSGAALGFAYSVTRFAVNITINSTTSAGNWNVCKNGATVQPNGVTIGAGATGWFSSAAGSTAFLATDVLSHLLTGGSGGTGTNAAGVGITISLSSAYSVAVAEAGAAADTVGSTANLPLSITEAGAAADTVSARQGFAASITEAGAAADTVGSTAALQASVAEAGAAADTVSSATTKVAAFTLTGSGAFQALGTARISASAAWTGHGALAFVGRTAARSSARFAGTATFAARGIGAAPVRAVARWFGRGIFSARGEQLIDLTLSHEASWSLMLYGKTIEGVQYDPTSRRLMVWYTGTKGQGVVLENMPIGVTLAIQTAPNPEAYVLSLIGQG